MKLKEIINKARQAGAGERMDSVKDWDDLARLFFSSRGEDFCVSNGFPHLVDFKDLETDLEGYNIYVSKGHVVKDNPRNIALVGGTHGVLYFDDNKIHKVVMMHGATADIKVRNFTTVRLVDEEIHARIDKDETSIVIF